MPDVFLSYSREDQAVARLFAEGLKHEGLTVWWDQALRSGEAYDQVTEAALRDARAVAVLWSKHSVESRWVRAEATTADRNGTLVPVMIESCNRPIMFELTHTAELSHWRGDPRDPAWRAYVEDVRRFAQRAQSRPATASGARQDHSATRAAVAHHSSAPGRSKAWFAAVAAISVVLLAAVFLVPRLRGHAQVTAAVHGLTSVAVMPFANLTGDSGKDYIGSGTADELINALGGLAGLTVPPRISSFAYQGRNVGLKQISADLGVQTVLEGSVRLAGGRMRISAELIDAVTGRRMWMESVEGPAADANLFALQDELAHKIVVAFRESMHVDLPELHAAVAPTSDPEAYALYLQGNALTQRTGATGGPDAVAAFQQALQRDPSFAEAYLGMANAMYVYGAPLESVEVNARKAAELKPPLASAAGRLLAGVAARRGHWVEAEDMFRALIDVPVEASRDWSNQTIRADHAIGTLWGTGKLHATIEAYDDAYRKAPALGGMILSGGRAHEAIGEFDKAAQMANAAIAVGVDPNGRQALQLYADLALHDGRYDDAADRMVAALSGSAKAAGGADVVHKVYAAMAGKAGRADAVQQLRTFTNRMSSADWVVRVWAMNWFTRLEAIDDAYAVAERLRQDFVKQSPTNAWSWLWSTELHAFRLDRRFSDFTARLGMHDYWKKFGPPDGCDMAGERLVCR